MRRAVISIVLVLLAPLCVSAVAEARRPRPVELDQPREGDRGGERIDAIADRSVALSLATAEQGRSFRVLPPLAISNRLGTTVALRLYDAEGHLDGEALRALDGLLADARDPAHVHEATIDRRTLQLVFRAAYHFDASTLVVISGYRQAGRRAEGNHAEGKAVDFQLAGVKPAALASYLRTVARVGVGVYTNPRTQFVHLDVRDRSYYWLDASPPGRTWRERSIPSGDMAARDAAYRAAEDWPEGTSPRDLRR